MPDIRIVPDAGEECTVTLNEFSRRVDPPEAFFDILDQLIATRRARVTLIGDVHAEAHWLTSTPTAAPARQSILPLREFVGEAQLMFELPGQIRVRAASHEEAHSIITDVVRKQRPPPPGFSIVFNADMRPGLPVRDIHLTSLIEQRLLDNRPPAEGAPS